MLWKCCTLYASKFGKLSGGHRTGKGLFSFQSQWKAMLKNTQTTASHTLPLISHTSKVMLKILQARLQQNVSCELLDVQAGFTKGRGTRNQIANICWIIEKAREHLLLLYWLCQSFWLCGSHKLWKILQEMGIPDHLTCLLRNQYAGQEATIRTGLGSK